MESKPRTIIVCPVCQKDDQLGKLASIVSSGTHQIEGVRDVWVPDNEDRYGYWSTTPVSGTQRSELAKKLAMPPQPVQPYIGSTSSLRWILSFLVLPMICMFCVAPGALLAGFSETIVTVIGILGILLGVILFIGYIIWFMSGRRRYAVDKPKWDKAWQTWNRLYYCGRDNLIFDPLTGKYFNVDSLNQYLFPE